MTVLLCEQDDDDDDEHDTTRLRPVRRHNVTTPTMTEINSDDSLFKFIANKGAKSPQCVEGSTRKTRKCTAACNQTKKGDRCTGAADSAAASLYCSDTVHKTYRPSPPRDRGSVCIKTAMDFRGQCTRTGKYAANDNPQCTSTRNCRANEDQCTGAAGKYGATDNPQCTSTRSYRANDSQCTGVGAGNYGANNSRCTGTGNYRANYGQCTGAGNYKTNNSECSGCGCGCISAAAAAAVAAAACLGGANALASGTSGSDDTLVTTAYKWVRVAVDWTWDKTSYFFVAAVSFFLGMYTYDWCLCTCEEVS